MERVGQVNASAGRVIMVNPGEMHDGAPLDGNARGWWMIYLDQAFVAREVEEEIVGEVEIVRPVARDPLLAEHFARLFACLTASSRIVLPGRRTYFAPDLHPAAAWDGAALVQWAVALHSKSTPAPRLCARFVSVSGRVGCTVGREPLPAFAGLRTRNRDNTACLPCSAARPPCTAPPGRWSNSRPSSSTGRLRGPESQTRAFVRQLGITPIRYRAAIA